MLRAVARPAAQGRRALFRRCSGAAAGRLRGAPGAAAPLGAVLMGGAACRDRVRPARPLRGHRTSARSRRIESAPPLQRGPARCAPCAAMHTGVLGSMDRAQSRSGFSSSSALTPPGPACCSTSPQVLTWIEDATEVQPGMGAHPAGQAGARVGGRAACRRRGGAAIRAARAGTRHPYPARPNGAGSKHPGPTGLDRQQRHRQRQDGSVVHDEAAGAARRRPRVLVLAGGAGAHRFIAPQPMGGAWERVIRCQECVGANHPGGGRSRVRCAGDAAH